MKYCINCGSKLDEGWIMCPNCGFALAKKTDSNNSGAMSSEKDTAAFELIEDIDYEIVLDENEVEEDDSEQEVLNEKPKKQEKATNNRLEAKHSDKAYKDSTRYMSSTELWSWLKQNAKRQLFFTEEISTISEDDFMKKVTKRLKENSVPASLEKRTIQWDRSSVTRSCYFIKPNTDVINPLSCLVQINHVGKYTFVEEKTFITPPDLPYVGKKRYLNPSLSTLIVILASLAGVFAFASLIILLVSIFNDGEALGAFFVILILAGLFGYFAISEKKKMTDDIEYNKKCDEQAAAWTDMWNNWENSIFIHSFQEDINGQLSRIYDAVYECIKQVCDDLFKDKPSVAKEEDTNMNELEELISKRKEEYR